LIVEVRANSSGRLNVFKVLEKLVELGQARSEIFHAHGSVFVEIQTQVVILYEDLNVGIGAVHVCYELLLTLIEYADQHSNEVGCLVIVKNDLFW